MSMHSYREHLQHQRCVIVVHTTALLLLFSYLQSEEHTAVCAATALACETCGFVGNGPKDLATHLGGRRHAADVAWLQQQAELASEKRGAITPPTKHPPGKYSTVTARLAWCSVYMTAPFGDHAS